MLFIELLHELATEHSNANSHGKEVHGEHILQDNGHRQDDAIEELLGDFEIVFRDAFNLHFFNYNSFLRSLF